MEEGNNVSISGVEETSETKEIGGEGEEREPKRGDQERSREEKSQVEEMQ